MRLSSLGLLSSLTFLLVGGTLCHADPSAAEELAAFLEWARRNAVPISSVEPGRDDDDLRPVKDMIGDARVVCLGESRHDIHEQFRFKHRLIRFLVEEMGFSVLTLEESLPHAEALNRFILGGPGDPHELLNSLGGWFIWDTEEMLEVMQWMREHNQNPGHQPIRIYGLDVMSPRLAAENALLYMEKVDPEFEASSVRKALRLDLIDDTNWQTTLRRCIDLSSEERDSLRGGYSDLLARFDRHRDRYVENSSDEEFRWAHRNAAVAKAGNNVFLSGSRDEGGMIRDRAMADNLMWILEEGAPGERIIVWAHNAHIARASFRMPDISSEPLVDMAVHLSEALGPRLITIAASFGHGEYSGPGPPGEVTFEPVDSDYMDGALARVGLPLFMLDLRAAPDEGRVTTWLSRERKMRGHDIDMSCKPSEAYDLFYFVERVTQAKRNPLALDRFKSLGGD